MSNSIAHKEKRRLWGKAKEKECNIRRPKRLSVDERKLAKAGG